MKRTSTSVDFCAIGLSFKAAGKYTPGDPGRYSGPPDKCYPSEPAEFEFHTLECDGKDASFLLDSTLFEELMDSAIAKLQEYDEPDEPPDMTDVEADADTLRSAGYGTDEDYGLYEEV